MVLQDHVGGLSLQDQGRDQFIQGSEVFRGNVNAGSGFAQDSPVLTVCGGGPVISLIKTASDLAAAGVADKGGFIQLRAMVSTGE